MGDDNSHVVGNISAACLSRTTPGQCGFDGNSDLYGLGIRLGLYLQLLAMALAMATFKHGSHDQVVTFNVFLFSFLIALFVVSFNGDCVFQVEAIILQYIVWCGIFTVFVGDLLVFDSTKGTFLAGSLYYYIATGYSFYFWLSLVRGGHDQFSPTPFGTSYFLLSQISAHNFRAGSIAILVFVCLSAGNIITSYALFVRGWIKWITRSSGSSQRLADADTSVSEDLHGHVSPRGNVSQADQHVADSVRRPSRVDSTRIWDSPPNPLRATFQGTVLDPEGSADIVIKFRPKNPHLVSAAFTLLILVWIILAVELPIRWNRIRGVYSLKATGQFIPLIISATNFAVMAWKYYYHSDLLGDGVEQLVPMSSVRAEQTDAQAKAEDPPQRPDNLGGAAHAASEEIQPEEENGAEESVDDREARDADVQLRDAVGPDEGATVHRRHTTW